MGLKIYSVEPANSGYLLGLNRKHVGYRLYIEILVLGLAMEAETYKAVYKSSTSLIYLFIQAFMESPVSDSEDKAGRKEKSMGLCPHWFGLVLDYKEINQTEDCAMRASCVGDCRVCSGELLLRTEHLT